MTSVRYQGVIQVVVMPDAHRAALGPTGALPVPVDSVAARARGSPRVGGPVLTSDRAADRARGQCRAVRSHRVTSAVTGSVMSPNSSCRCRNFAT